MSSRRRKSRSGKSKGSGKARKGLPLSSEIQAEIEGWALEATDVEELVLYDVDIVPRGAWLIRVFVDKPDAEPGETGVSVDNCVKVSRYMEAYLDADERVPESYQLEVSSPGVERPLKKDRHVELAQGKLVSVTVREPVDGQNKFVGELLSFKDGVLEIHDRELDKAVNVNWEDVAKAQLKYDFEE